MRKEVSHPPSTLTLHTILLNSRIRFDGNLTQDKDSDNKAAVKMDIRKLSAVLNHSSLALSSAIFCKSILKFVVCVGSI